MSLQPHAETSFAKSAAYDAHRPGYTASLVQTLLEQTRVAGKPGAHIIDLAAGTGKLTEVLAARPEGFRITAVEPLAAMREVLVAKKLPNVKVVDGTAAATGLEDEGADAVLVAQAFHWFAEKSTLREMHRILQPHGTMGMIWNLEDYNAPRSWPVRSPWEGRVKELLRTTATASDDTQPRFRDEKWREVFDSQIKMTPLALITASTGEQLFSLPLGEAREQFEFVAGKEAAWERYGTLGHIAALEGEAREHVRQEFMTAINAEDVQTNAQGEVTVHGTSYAAWTTKIPVEGRSTLLGVERPGA